MEINVKIEVESPVHMATFMTSKTIIGKPVYRKQLLATGGFYDIQVADDVVFFEPVNGNPYIVILGNCPQSSTRLYTKITPPNSGSAKLKARMLMQIEFDRLTKEEKTA